MTSPLASLTAFTCPLSIKLAEYMLASTFSLNFATTLLPIMTQYHLLLITTVAVTVVVLIQLLSHE